MDHNYIIEKLSNNFTVFKGLLENISEEQSRWRPAPEKWSLLEITNHLYDEEREDFRQRFQLLSEETEKSWPPIRPAEWVKEREYNSKEMKKSTSDFLREREKSSDWLKSYALQIGNPVIIILTLER